MSWAKQEQVTHEILNGYIAIRLGTKGYSSSFVTDIVEPYNWMLNKDSNVMGGRALRKKLWERGYKFDNLREYFNLVSYACTYLVGQYTGMRPSELSEIRVQDCSCLVQDDGVWLIESTVKKHKDEISTGLFDDRWVAIPIVKDAILAAAFQEGQYLIWGIAMFTAFLTAFYMFRMYFIVFVAPNHHDEEYVYTSKTITIPLLILAIGAIGAGFLNLPAIFGGNHFVDTWLAQLHSKHIHMDHTTEYVLMALSIIVAATGIMAAYKKYAKFDVTKPELETGLIGNKFYIDEIYDFLFVKSSKKLSTFIDKVVDDKNIRQLCVEACDKAELISQINKLIQTPFQPSVNYKFILENYLNDKLNALKILKEIFP